MPLMVRLQFSYTSNCKWLIYLHSYGTDSCAPPVPGLTHDLARSNAFRADAGPGPHEARLNCFLNAVLQALLHIQPFIRLLVRVRPSPNEALTATRHLLYEVYSENVAPLVPTAHLNCLSSRLPG